MIAWKKTPLPLFAAFLAALLLCGCGAAAAPQPESVTAVMTAEELSALEGNPNLSHLDVSGSTCYDAIEAFIEAHPEVEVVYTVDVGGVGYAPDTAAITVENSAQMDALLENCAWLKALNTVTVRDGAASAEQLRALRAALPDATLDYSVQVLGLDYSGNISSLDLGALTAGEVAQTADALALLPALEKVSLPEGLSVEDYIALKKAAPQAQFDYSFELFGQTVTTETESLSYVSVPIGNAGVLDLVRILPYLENLRSLRFEYCDIDDWAMADLRDAFPDREIVWRVVYGWGSSMSDAETIWAIGGFSDQLLSSLKYCTKVKYLDIGHNGIFNLDFVRYMPDLEVLIIENDFVSDLSPLASCRKIEYLEVGETRVTDLSPLAECTSLEHLNVGGLLGLTDITPLYGLPNLKRLYGLCDVNVPREQVDTIKSLMPDTEIDFDYYAKGAVNGGHWRYDENGIVPRYQLLHDQMGYYW